METILMAEGKSRYAAHREIATQNGEVSHDTVYYHLSRQFRERKIENQRLYQKERFQRDPDAREYHREYCLWRNRYTRHPERYLTSANNELNRTNK